jgi:hypothetical protein
MELGDCLPLVKNVAEKAQSSLDEIFTEAAWIQLVDFGATHNWKLFIKQASAQNSVNFSIDL